MSFNTKWIKTGKVHDFVFIGKENIATACGNHVIFHNLSTKEERIEYFNSPSRGEGACCLAGHEIMPIFSTTERRFCPKIYIHTFPEIKKVAECKLDSGPNSYLSCCFMGTEYLVSLTSYPSFELIIWLWRTGENVHSVKTALTDFHQVIEASIHSNQLIYQFSPRSGKLWTHEILTYSKKVTIIKNFIKINERKISSVHWMNTGNLLMSDSLQNVYIVSVDGKKCQSILLRDFEIESINNFLILPYINIFFTVDNDSQLSCYSKSSLENNSSESWNLTWSAECKSHPLKMALARHKEAILIYSQSGEILELDIVHENKRNFENIYDDCQKIKYVCMLEPDRVNIIAVDYSNCLYVIDVFNGVKISSFAIDQEDQVICMVSHPNIPLVAVSTLTGKVMFFMKLDRSFINIETLYLQREPLEKMRFARSGTSLGISSTASKYFFMLKIIITEKIDVFYYTEFNKFIIDFLIFENDQKIILLVMSQRTPDVDVSNCIEIYTIEKWENANSNKRLIFTSHFYKHLNYSSEKCGDFLGSPYLSKQINLFQFKDDFQSVNLFNVIGSTHKMRRFHISTSTEYLLTSGFDGFIVLRSFSDLTKVIKTYMAHHYQEQGTKFTAVSLNHNIIICLGNNGSLICTSFGESVELKKIKSLVNNKIIRNFINLHKDTSKFKIDANYIWLEDKKLKLAKEEISKTLILKTNVLENLDLLKKKVGTILDLNEMKSIECQTPISAFDLNNQIRKEKFDSSVIEQEAEKERLQRVISKKEGIINYFIQQFWDTYEVHDCSLKTFDSDIFVKNYKLRYLNKAEIMDDFFIELFDIPLPIKSIKSDNKTVEEEINEILVGAWESSKNTTAENGNLLSTYTNNAVLSGSTSFRYIDSDAPPNQLSSLVFDTINSHSSREYQLKVRAVNLFLDKYLLKMKNTVKVHFNNKFNDIRSLKNKVLNETKQRLKDLSAYHKELQDIFGIILENRYSDESKLQLDESLAHFITNSEETSLSNNQSITLHNSTDKNTSRDLSNSIDHCSSTLPEHEQLFREEKLTDMMDGLLEIRWEDEIKKEVSKPYCLLLKHPSKYNDEEIKAVAVYKIKVEKLRIERKKYRTRLESQIQRINEQIKADVESFDRIMEDFSLEKVKIQSAILQEFLLRLNSSKQKFLKDHESKKVSKIINNDLAYLENENKMLVNEILKVEPIVVELRNKYDNFNKRDKVLETKFRSEFDDLKQPLVEHLLRQYKRRPKISQISCTSLTCLTETNKCLVTGKKSTILPQEYLDFLRGMDALDIMPNSLPPQIDGNHWQILCKLRRNKLETEIKLKIAALELAEAEQTYFHLQKLSSFMQSKIYFIKNSMEEETLKQLKFYNDSEIQLILEAGQIEISVMGSIKDFEIAIVVTYDQLMQINVDIVKEGQKKIAAMQAAMFVRKSILYTRWKYQCMSTKLKHWQEQLIVLQNVKIGKDMQNYLVERLEKNIHYKDATSSGKILSSIEKKFQRMLKDKKIILRRTLKEMNYWREVNAELTNKIQMYESLKQHQKLELEETHLQKRNRSFHKHHLRVIMERTSLVEKLKESRNELLNLQTQLELLKLKTYPTLRFKDICHHKRSNNSIKS